MKILYTITFLHFGAGRALADLAIEAGRRGHEVVIAATKKINQFESQPHLIADAEKAGVQVVLYDDLFTRDFNRVSLSADRLTELFREQRFDLIHSHAAIPAFAAALCSRKVHGRFLPQILTMHSWGPDKPDWMKQQDVYILNNMDAIIAISFDLVDYLSNEGVKRDLVHMIYNGCNFKRIDELTVQESDQRLNDAKKFRIGTVADLSPRKGVNYLIEAVAKLPPEIMRDLEVVIVGDGPDKERLMRQAGDLKVEHVINFTGYSSNPFYYMSRLALFILPSLSEGLPVSLVEAMYLKVPVLATDVQGSREIVKANQNGTLIPPRDSNKLAWAIQDFYFDRTKYTAKTIPAYNWVTQNFNRQASFDRIFSLYELILQKGVRNG